MSKCECGLFTLASLVGKINIDLINTQVNENIIVAKCFQREKHVILEQIREIQQTLFNIQQIFVEPPLCARHLWVSDNHTLFIQGLDVLIN